MTQPRFEYNPVRYEIYDFAYSDTEPVVYRLKDNDRNGIIRLTELLNKMNDSIKATFLKTTS